jgi:hypothetical protein
MVASATTIAQLEGVRREVRWWRGFCRWAGMTGGLAALAACGASDFNYTPNATQQLAAAQDTYFLEYCAGSGMKMKPGYPPDVSGGPGGHAAFFLEGACRDASAGYPTLRMCDDLPSGAAQGAGVSMDGNFSNANWTVTSDRDFFYNGGLAKGERLTPAVFRRVQHTAESMGILDGLVFRPELFNDKPAWMSNEDFRYGLSVGTDYGLTMGRGLYCARVPVSRPQMVRMVAFLNAKNAIYKTGPRHFTSSIIEDNCVHLPHNALAACDVMSPWPTNGFIPFALFDFPVPKNDFVNVMRRTNDTRMDDLLALYDDLPARRQLLEFGRLPSEPGALASAYPPHAPNDVFGTKLDLIFYDTPGIGAYPPWFDQIFSEPRYTDATANLHYFAALYAHLAASRRPVGFWENKVDVSDRASFAEFYARYYERLAKLRVEIDKKLGGGGPNPAVGLSRGDAAGVALAAG